MVLLDVTPSQDMVDEGVAREVINKIQKLRKKVFFLIKIKKRTEVLDYVVLFCIGGASAVRPGGGVV